MEAKNTVMTWKQTVECSHNPVLELRIEAIKEAQAEISFKAGIRHVLSRAVGEGCLSNVNGKHGVHIPDELYEELSKQAK